MGVPRLPVLDGQELPERHLRFKRRLRFHEPKAVGNAVDVYVDSDGRQVKADRHRQVRRLAPDAGKFAELFDRVR